MQYSCGCYKYILKIIVATKIFKLNQTIIRISSYTVLNYTTYLHFLMTGYHFIILVKSENIYVT